DWRRSAMIRHEELGLLRPPLHLYWTGARFTMHLLRVLFFTGLLLASCKAEEPPNGGGGAGSTGGGGWGGEGGAGGGDGGEGGGGIACPDPGPEVPGPDDPSVSVDRYHALAAGGFLCGIRDDGTLACWSGDNLF